MNNSINPKTQNKELVINWHLTEVCNFSCDYCYAKWGKPNELIVRLPLVEKLINSLAHYFLKSENPIKRAYKYSSVRINLAGGEPMLHKHKFLKLISIIKNYGFNVSLITNGFYFDDSNIDVIASKVSMIGISFDSQCKETSKNIGRVNRKGEMVDAKKISEIFKRAKQVNPNIKTKLNTVVNQFNKNEDFSNAIKGLSPDKWKVFQVMPYGDNKLLISPKEYKQFLERHIANDISIYGESNTSMTDSYLMIDPLGRFYQNSNKNDENYLYSSPILDAGVEHAFMEINFDHTKFEQRYKPIEVVLL